ncbi:phenolic acid decarboxylase [Streptomyces sp. URMC 128]|uniref:phenolic acid decarboxylase n=1 Tax=Streptomyces sp. URMC 128 TaxID=3423404 RepID=UPI003F1AD079
MAGNAAHVTTVENPVPAQELSGIVGHRFIYTYANGWQYEMYVKNPAAIEFAKITLFEYVGPDDDTVISTAPGDLPPGWSDRTD